MNVFRKLIIIFIIVLFTVVDSKILLLDKNCATPTFKNNYFIIACNNKIFKISKDLKIENKKQNSIIPIEVFKADKNIYLFDENDTLYKIEKSLNLKKIKKLNLDKNNIFNLDSLNKWAYVKNNILYLSLMSADNFPVVLKFNFSNNKEKIYKINLKNCKPFMHTNYQEKDLVFCRNLKKFYDAVYDLKSNKILCKTNYSGFYIAKEINGTLKTVGFDYINKNLFVVDFKDNKFSNKNIFPIFLIPHFITNNGITIYGNLMKQTDGKSKALVKYNLENKTTFVYDVAPFYLLPLKIYNSAYKALFVYYNKKSKVYIFNAMGKLIKTLKISKKLLPSYSKLFIIDSKIYLWNFDEKSKKFYLNKI